MIPEMEIHSTVTQLMNKMTPEELVRPNSLYISGPMANKEDFNHPLFFEVDEALTDIGIDVVNPAAMDVLDGIQDDGTGITPLRRAELLKRDFSQQLDCEGIVFLEGWEDSIGANCELLVAQMAGMSTWLWVDALYPEPNLNANVKLIFGHVNNVVWGLPSDG